MFGYYYKVIHSLYARYYLFLTLSLVTEAPHLFYLYYSHYQAFKNHSIVINDDFEADKSNVGRFTEYKDENKAQDNMIGT